jgi:hypothetical protein
MAEKRQPTKEVAVSRAPGKLNRSHLLCVGALTCQANSLRALNANQRFFVIFYTDQTYPQFYPNNLISLIMADRTNISNILSWMERSQTQGGTEPQEAVAISLGLKPDVMFFLSDGEIPLNTRHIVQQANRGTAIHTIAFGSNAGGHILKQIATDTRGTHRFTGDGF